MGVVRREREWRLEKTGEGEYEISYDHDPQLVVLTPEANGSQRVALAGVPTREVGSFEEAKGLFEEMAHEKGPARGLFDDAGDSDPLIPDESNDGWALGEVEGGTLDDTNLPPGGFALVLLAVGGLFLTQSGISPNSMVFLLGIGMIAGGSLIFAWAGVLFRTKGPSEAMNFLTEVEEDDAEQSGGGDKERTPPTPQKLKDKLYFDRADQECEWCENSCDNPHVHHIEPRREGGPNTPSNLIVLCPNCHEKADREAIPRSKLKAKVRRLPDISVD